MLITSLVAEREERNQLSCCIPLELEMSAVVRAGAIIGLLLLAGCGHTTGSRALTGGLIGAGGGAALGAITGLGAGTGALIGGVGGAGIGALTR